MDDQTKLRAAADITERLYPNGTLHNNYVEMLRLCAEFKDVLDGLEQSE